MTVPVQALEVEHRLCHPAVTCLLHPQDAVHALDCTAGPNRVVEDRPNPVISRLLDPIERSVRSHGISHRSQRTRRWTGAGIPQSPPPPSQHLAPFCPWLGHLETLMQSIQEGKAARVREEVADLPPFGAGQLAQAGLDFGLRPVPIVESAIGPEQLKCSAATTPARLETVHLFKCLSRFGPSSTSSASGPPCVDALRLGALDTNIAVLRPLPKQLGPTPFLRQYSLGFLSRMEQIQSMHQTGCRGVVLATMSVDLCDRRFNPFGGVRDGEIEVFKANQLLLPGLGTAIAGVVTEDCCHTHGLDSNQGRSPPKKISSTAKV